MARRARASAAAAAASRSRRSFSAFSSRRSSALALAKTALRWREEVLDPRPLAGLRRDLLGRGPPVGQELGAELRERRLVAAQPPDHLGVLPADAVEEVDLVDDGGEAAGGDEHLGEARLRGRVDRPHPGGEHLFLARDVALGLLAQEGVLVDALVDLAELVLGPVVGLGRRLHLGVDARSSGPGCGAARRAWPGSTRARRPRARGSGRAGSRARRARARPRRGDGKVSAPGPGSRRGSRALPSWGGWGVRMGGSPDAPRPARRGIVAA